MTQCEECGAPCGTRYKKNQNGGYLCEKCYQKSQKETQSVVLVIIGLIICCVVGSAIALPLLKVISPIANKVGYNIASVTALAFGVILLVGSIVTRFIRKKKHGFVRFILLLVMFLMFSTGLVLIISCFYQDGKILKSSWGMEVEQQETTQLPQ